MIHEWTQSGPRLWTPLQCTRAGARALSSHTAECERFTAVFFAER
jgi:hypothetical protein